MTRRAVIALPRVPGGCSRGRFWGSRQSAVAAASLLLVLLVVVARLQRQRVLAGPIVDVRLKAGAQPMVEAGSPVRYSVAVSNHGFAEATSVVVTHTLPAGFGYQGGSSRVVLDGQEISLGDPEGDGRSLTWGPFTIPGGWGVFDNHYGIHTFVQDLCVEVYIDFQLDKAQDLIGVGGHVTQLLYPITASTQSPHLCWVYFVNAAYDRGLVPILRLQGVWGGDFWIKPEPDSPGDYTSIAEAYRRVVEGLPRRDGRTLYVQIWNEPDLPLEWSGEPSAWEYGHFFVDVAQAIHSIGDPRIKVLNGALSPGNAYFTRQLTDVPGFVGAFDLWASHCYPLNHPPSYNIHAGPVRYPQYTIDCYLLELQALATYGGRHGVRVLLTETGYGLYDHTFRGYPAITEDNRASCMESAFRDYWPRWPEVVGATPFELVDPYDTWQRWDWLFPTTDVPHKQYTVVKALAKPQSLEINPSRLIITFTAVAAETTGTYFSDVAATAANTIIDPLRDVAPVMVVDTLHTQHFPLVAAGAPALKIAVSSEPEQGWVTDVEEVLERIDLSHLEAEPFQQSPVKFLVSPERPWAALRVLGRIPLGSDPGSIALHLSRSRAYVTLGGGLLVTVDTNEWRVLCAVPVESDPGPAAVSPATGVVYVASRGDGTVSVVHGGGCGVVQTISGLKGASGVAVDELASRLYVSDAHTGEVVAFDAGTGQEVVRVKVGAYPEALALDRAHGLLYVANAGDGSLSVLDSGSLAVVRTIKIAQGPLLDLAIDEAGGRVYVLHLGPPPRRQVTVVDGHSGELLASLAGGREHPLAAASAAALDPQRGVIYLADGRELLAVDVSSLRLTSVTPVDAVIRQSGLAVNEESGTVYLVDSVRGELVILGP